MYRFLKDFFRAFSGNRPMVESADVPVGCPVGNYQSCGDSDGVVGSQPARTRPPGWTFYLKSLLAILRSRRRK